MRRALTIAAIVIVVIGLLVGGYFLFFANRGPSLTATSPSVQNPFGESGGVATTSTASTAGETTGNIPTQVAEGLLEITSAPVAKGFLALDASTTPVTALGSTTDASSSEPGTPQLGLDIRYIDRESGNMYSYDSLTNASTRLTNHTIPGVEEASWLPDGSVAYVRFLSDDSSGTEQIQTYALPSDGSDGSFLANDLSRVIAENAGTLLTFLPSTSGTLGTTAHLDGSPVATLFSSPLSSLSFANSAGALVAYTKPSADLPGYAFLVDRKSGAFSTILGPLPGLTALPSPSGAEILVSYLNNGALQLASYDVKTHALTALPVATFAEKCAWANGDLTLYCAVPETLPSGAFLDSWYQGETAFTDRIWKIDFAARVATLVADLPSLTKTPIDAVSLTTDPDGRTLVFMNRRDDSLWAYSF